MIIFIKYCFQNRLQATMPGMVIQLEELFTSLPFLLA